MKSKVKVLLASSAIALAAALTISCASAKKEQPLTPQQQAMNQMAIDREAYLTQQQARIDQLQKFSQNLRQQSATAQAPRNKKLTNAADDLDSLLKDATSSMTGVRTAAPENWTDYKRDVEKSMSRAETQYSNSVRLLQ
jgi:hypothetical protein